MASVFTSNDLDHVLEVPRGFFKRPFGFSLDIGKCKEIVIGIIKMQMNIYFKIERREAIRM